MSAVVSTAEKPRVRKWLPHLGTWDCALSGKWLQGAGNRNQNNGGLVSRRPRNRGSSGGGGGGLLLEGMLGAECGAEVGGEVDLRGRQELCP